MKCFSVLNLIDFYQKLKMDFININIALAVLILITGCPGPSSAWALEGLGNGSSRVLEVEELPPDHPQEEGEEWPLALMAGGNTQSPDDSSTAVMQNNTEILAQVGGTATFTCQTHHLSDEVVTWLKRDNDLLLTVGQTVYVSESRFSAQQARSKAWELFVKDVQLSDAGQYECQLPTHPPVSFYYTLKVTQALAVVSGPSEVHIEEGSKLDLKCDVIHAAAPPVFIFWYHNDTMVNYEKQRALQVKHTNYTSSLVVHKVEPSDAGRYTCTPSLATKATVTVHVETGQAPAAIADGRKDTSSSTRGSPVLAQYILLLLLICKNLTLQ